MQQSHGYSDGYSDNNIIILIKWELQANILSGNKYMITVVHLASLKPRSDLRIANVADPRARRSFPLLFGLTARRSMTYFLDVRWLFQNVQQITAAGYADVVN